MRIPAAAQPPEPRAEELHKPQQDVRHLEAPQPQILDGPDELKKLVTGNV
jgi:hypothetical protein